MIKILNLLRNYFTINSITEIYEKKRHAEFSSASHTLLENKLLKTQVPCISYKPCFRMTGKDDVIYKKKAFSLAEALITLTIISLILAATLPVISKRQNTTDSMWRYITQGTGSNSSIYYGLGNSQTAIIGDIKVPESSKGSRLILVTPKDNNGDTIRRSLIDFYQKTATGNENIGRIALDTHGNTALGRNSLKNNTFTGLNTAGIENTAVGTDALKINTTGYSNTAMGDGALTNNEVGASNTAIGTFTLYNNKADNNVAVGRSAMQYNTTGNNNTASGVSALRYNTTGTANTANGYAALLSNTTGIFNTAVGESALRSNTISNSNTAMGNSALSSNTTGSFNSAYGVLSCSAIISGSGNVYLGISAGPYENRDNRLYIDNARRGDDSLITGHFADRWVKISGTLYGASWNVISSDARLKNIGKENKIGLERILKLKVKNYTYKKDKNKRKRVGVIAQELKKVFPDSVIEGPGDNKYKSLLYIDTSEILFAMVNSIKQLYTKLVNVTNRITQLEKENKELKIQITKMNQRLKKLETKLQ